jgi:hypothetical protein
VVDRITWAHKFIKDMTDDKKPMNTDKPMGVLALVLAIALTIDLISTVKTAIQKAIFVVMAIFGQTTESGAPRAFGYVAMTAFMCYLTVRLFKYSGKKLSSHDQPVDEDITD